MFALATKGQIIQPTFIDSVLTTDNRYLKVDVYRPASCTGQCPTILIQTPYNKNGFKLAGLPLGVKYNINSSNYIFVIMDWRGRFSNTAAAYAGNPSMGKDGKDVVQWIAAQSWSDGKVGTWGPSALGKVQFATAKENPANLTCICPLVAAPQYEYQEYFPGGCLKTEYLEQLDGLGFGMSPFMLQNPTRNLVWQFTENSTYRPDSIFVPALMIGGWYDHAIDPMLRFFNGMRNLSPAAVKDKHRLQMGPWAHGGNGTAYVGSSQQGQLSYPNAAGDNDTLALKFFDFYLRNINNGYNTTPYVTYYQLGDNTWNSSTSWPISGMSNVNYYMHADNSLKTSAPTLTGSALSFSYNPNNPSPTIGGATLRQDLVQGPFRQDTAVENRNDILVFTTDVLTQDVRMKGKAKVTLKISSNRKDTDFAIRLCDVYPDGKSMLVQTGVMRMRFRNGFAPADTANMIPGTIYTATVDIPATCITFKAGHKIRVNVSSSNYPQYNRNMNTGGAMYPGPSTDTLVNPVVASNTVHLNNVDFSFISLPLDLSVGVNEIVKNEIEFSVYPNPSSNEVFVYTPNNESGWIELFDLNGKFILSEEVTQTSTKLSLKNIDAGIYLLRYKSESGVGVKKVIVER